MCIVSPFISSLIDDLILHRLDVIYAQLMILQRAVLRARHVFVKHLFRARFLADMWFHAGSHDALAMH